MLGYSQPVSTVSVTVTCPLAINLKQIDALFLGSDLMNSALLFTAIIAELHQMGLHLGWEAGKVPSYRQTGTLGFKYRVSFSPHLFSYNSLSLSTYIYLKSVNENSDARTKSSSPLR